MGILSGNPKDEPLHYGEVFSIWEASMMAKGSISCYEAFMYHAGDKELKKLIQDFLDQARLEVKECDELLTDNGISPSPMLAERPAAELEDIPPGARFTDPEIAAKLAADNALGLVSCSKTMGLSIREDVGALFAKYHVTKTALGLRVLRMNKEKGWLVPPPLVAKQPE